MMAFISSTKKNRIACVLLRVSQNFPEHLFKRKPSAAVSDFPRNNE